MEENKVGPIAAMILGGLVLMAGAFFGGKPDVTPEPASRLKGTLLLVVHEKTSPPIDETIELRRASEFVKANGFDSFLVVDQDDPNFANLVQSVANREIKPPFLAAGRMEGQKLVELIKAVEWKDTLEDILK